MTTAVPRLGSIVLDCPDPRVLAEFYARLLDWPAERIEAEAENGWVTLRTPNDGVLIEFQSAPDYLPPTWPEPTRQQMLHLDLVVDDLAAGHDRAVELGAKHLDTQRTFRVYADPAGHPFCLCAS